MLRIGIYGGSFSPIHNGHIKAVKAFLEQMQLDFCYVIPTFIPPHKATSGVIAPEHRIRMCELAFKDTDGIVVSDIEIKRGGTSYTVDTLRQLAGDDRRLFFLMGTDMLLTLDKWRSPDEIFKLCYPVYMRRENDGAKDAEIIEKIADYRKRFGKTVMKIVADPIEISSTVVRSKIARGEDVSSLIPQAVEDYVRENGLYLSED
jgi:nicotinate-nucleotide adenylyltransferase